VEWGYITVELFLSDWRNVHPPDDISWQKRKIRKNRRTCVISLSTVAPALVQTQSQSRDVNASDCCRNFEWRRICNIYRALKTKLSAGKHFGEKRTKSGSYISRDEYCTVLPNHSAVACVTFSPEGSGSQSVLRGSLGIRRYLCVMTTLRFNLLFI